MKLIVLMFNYTMVQIAFYFNKFMKPHFKSAYCAILPGNFTHSYNITQSIFAENFVMFKAKPKLFNFKNLI